jgi:hypothetical protein
MNIALAIMHIHPTSSPTTDFTVQDDSDGQGAYIAVWNVKDATGNDIPKPTAEELQTAWDAIQLHPPLIPEPDAEKIIRLESEKALLGEQVAEINRNFTDFVDFYFTNNPELV